MAGFSVEGYIEVVPEARATFDRNFPGAKCLGEDIRAIDEARVKDLLAQVNIDVLAGGRRVRVSVSPAGETATIRATISSGTYSSSPIW